MRETGEKVKEGKAAEVGRGASVRDILALSCSSSVLTFRGREKNV